ncbi:GIY-YIG nuclease family protein [Candidatus Palauibacter sp.]|uniref:GIY-YIG nuclease family protein n=1 Tax=Candidatus Palauibacter sp. TaxID=3101350 RepID=UPI003B596090
MPDPYAIQIFMAEGLPNGLRFVEKPNWNGKGIVCPRDRYSTVKKRPEFSNSGVYILVGCDGHDLPGIYVGVSESVRSRIDEHDKNIDFWQQAIVFTRRDPPLNRAEFGYIESRLVQLARVIGRCRLKNGNSPRPPTLSAADKAAMDGYVAEVQSLLPVLGVHAFERTDTSVSHSAIGPGTKTILTAAPAFEGATEVARADRASGEATPRGRRMFYLKSKGCNATALETVDGFTVMKGSTARNRWAPSAKRFKRSYFDRREELIAAGILIHKTGAGREDSLCFVRDHAFKSPSRAALICAGTTMDYLSAWVDESGVSLREHRARKAGA